MKLTKGKILKLYNKNKQSNRKKNINLKTNNKKNTFRKINKLNLANKSLKKKQYKKYRGGEEGSEVGLGTPTSVVNEPMQTPKDEKSIATEPTVTQPVAPPVEEVKPPAEQVKPEQVVEPPAEQVVEPPAEQVVEPPAEEVVEPPAEEVPPITVTNSFYNIINYITDKITQKVSQNIVQPSSTNNSMQNGFNAVKQASETLAVSGGKKHKTRRVRFASNTKTRHSY